MFLLSGNFLFMFNNGTAIIRTEKFIGIGRRFMIDLFRIIHINYSTEAALAVRITAVMVLELNKFV